MTQTSFLYWGIGYKSKKEINKLINVRSILSQLLTDVQICRSFLTKKSYLSKYMDFRE